MIWMKLIITGLINQLELYVQTLYILNTETIIDKLENASTRTLVSLDEARTLFASSSTNDLHIKTVYDFWHERRTIRVHFLSISLI